MALFVNVGVLRQAPKPSALHAVLGSPYAKPILGPPNGRPSEPVAFGGGLNFLLGDRPSGQDVSQKFLGLSDG